MVGGTLALAVRAEFCYLFLYSGALAQLGERRLCKPEVRGSTPLRSTRRKSFVNHTFCYLPVFGSAALMAKTKPVYAVLSHSTIMVGS